jgi:hypothetical protein
MKKPSTTRRTFLKKSAAALALPTIVPSTIFGKNGSVPPSEKIVLGAIGIGPRGRRVLGYMLDEPDVQFVGVSDVQASRREQVRQMANTKYGNNDCATYIDMFEILDRPDIDAVLIATGDRWHALGSILAAKAGKDVYSEKPCGLTMGECQALSDVMNRHGRVFQAGTQRRSISNFLIAIELARSGKLGKLERLHASVYWPGIRYDWLPAQPEPPRNVVDWDRWLGPAPWRPYNKSYVRGRWRGHYDFESGWKMLDWGAHTVDLCQMANDADGTTPIEYTPHKDKITARYANGVGLVIDFLKDPFGDRSPHYQTHLGTCPVRFVGDEGWVETGDSGGIEVYPKSLRAETQKIVKTKGTVAVQHARNFFDCVKSRALTNAHAKIMRYSHVACHAAAIGYELGRTVRFDPVREAFVDDEDANRMRTRAKRAPWHV